MTPFERRARACQERLREQDADAAVLFPSSNLSYVTGCAEEPSERHLLCVIPATGDPVFVAPTLYAAQLADTWVEAVRTYDDGDDPLALVEGVAVDLDLTRGTLLLDPTTWATFVFDLRETLPDATFGLVDEVFADLRVRKDAAELDALRRAAALTDRVARDVRALGADAVGLTERELAREIAQRLTEAGGEGLAFEVIVGSGPNGARPHHRNGDRTIQAGDPVVLDFGTRLEGYPSDQTRTLVFDGEPSPGFVEAFEAVRDAQRDAVAAVEPGVTAGEVDRIARAVIEGRGFGDAFVHRTGHGVGLDVHEEPYISPGSDCRLEPGMVFSVEPGVYLEGQFGVRIEDLVVVTDAGCERLNDSPRGWRCG